MGERAGLVSAIYIECYLRLQSTRDCVGLLAHAIGLTTATYIDGIGIIILAAISLAATVSKRAAFGRIRGGLRRNDILLEGRRESVHGRCESLGIFSCFRT